MKKSLTRSVVIAIMKFSIIPALYLLLYYVPTQKKRVYKTCLRKELQLKSNQRKSKTSRAKLKSFQGVSLCTALKSFNLTGK